jgi:hypothetical protein
MSNRMTKVIIGAGASVSLAALATLVAPGAQAASGLATSRVNRQNTPVVCTIQNTSPAEVDLWVTPQRVTFDVATDCDQQYHVSWDLNSDIYPGSSGASWLLLRNYHLPNGEKFTHVEDRHGRFTVDFIGTDTFRGNKMAGVRPLSAFAFYDANHDGVNQEPTDYSTSSFVAKRATTFGSSFNAAPNRPKPGETITITGNLQRANWDTGAYDGYATTVTLQFQPAGSDAYTDVKQVTDDGTSATTTVQATQSGRWRYHYSGDGVSGASDSKSDKVVVR